MALYRRGRLWYADYYADGVRVQESWYGKQAGGREDLGSPRVRSSTRGFRQAGKHHVAGVR